MQPINRFFSIIGFCISRKIYSFALFIVCWQINLAFNFLFTYIATPPPWLTRSERYTLYPSHDISTSHRLWTIHVSDTHITSISELTNMYLNSLIFFGRLETRSLLYQDAQKGMTICCWIIQVFFHCE